MDSVLITISSVLIVVSSIPYVIDVVHKKTKPRIVSWLTWGVLTLIAAFASLSDQQYAAAILSFSASAVVFIIFILGIIYDSDKSLERFDIVCLASALIGFILWIIFNSPSIAIIFVITIDLIASLPTIKHAWQKPGEETMITFLGSAVAALLTLLAANTISITAFANPLYLVAINFLIAAIIVLRGRAHTSIKSHKL